MTNFFIVSDASYNRCSGRHYYYYHRRFHRQGDKALGCTLPSPQPVIYVHNPPSSLSTCRVILSSIMRLGSVALFLVWY